MEEENAHFYKTSLQNIILKDTVTNIFCIMIVL